MVFVEFQRADGDGREYFVGASLQDVLDDTNGGTEFGYQPYSSYREVSIEKIRSLDLGFLEEGMASVESGNCVSYMLRSPEAQKRWAKEVRPTT